MEEEAKVEALALDGSFICRGSLPLTTFAQLLVSCSSKLGRRRNQEDRITVCPKLFKKDNVGFYGVFDGTVGETAAEFAHRRLLANIATTPSFRSALEAGEKAGSYDSDEIKAGIRKGVEEGFAVTDEQLLSYARLASKHYAASTGVVVIITGDVLTVAHVGDSRAALAQVSDGGDVCGTYLTFDHKPDMPDELARIEAAGGSLAYLHGGKPFLRGGDFAERKAAGGRPMQLNYSRAFGGKDLKPFGLSAVPDVHQMKLTDDHTMVILGSDGLWDVVNPDTAVAKAVDARLFGRDPAAVLADYALAEHDAKRTVDNVSVVVVFLRELIR